MSIAEVSQNTDVRKVAALDLGSNSFHLVVARIVADDIQILHQIKLRARLAEGLDDDGWLSNEAIERGLDHLRTLAESLKDFKPDEVRIVATYTLRKARNAREFVKAARHILPYPVEIVSGSEEARLIYMGIAHTLHHDGSRLVIDIGGGSTETIVGQGFEPKLRFSLSMGCVTYTKRFFSDGAITTKQMKRAIKTARQEVAVVSESLLALGWDNCIGSSGTISAVLNAACEINDRVATEGITLSDLEALMKVCIDTGATENLAFSGISNQRRNVFPAGLAILIGLFKALKISSLTYSPAALREGVLYEMEDSLAHRDIRERTAQSLVTRYVVDTQQASRVEATAHHLFDQVRKPWGISKPELGSLLSWAALLHEVGLQINSRSSHKHGEYILKNIDMPGFNQEQQAVLAKLVRFQRKKIRSEEFTDFLFYSAPEIGRLIVLLRLSVLLNFKRQDNVLPDIKARARADTLTVAFPKDWLSGHAVIAANLEQEELFLKILGVNLDYH